MKIATEVTETKWPILTKRVHAYIIIYKDVLLQLYIILFCKLVQTVNYFIRRFVIVDEFLVDIVDDL